MSNSKKKWKSRPRNAKDDASDVAQTGKMARCDKCNTNHPAWYKREDVPDAIGANFDAMTSINVQPYVLPNGISLNVGIQHRTVIAPPIDEYNSLKKAAVNIYTQLQAKNRSASQYTPMEVLALLLNMHTAYALAYTANRMCKAVRSRQKLSLDSPYALIAMSETDLQTPPSTLIADYVDALDALALVEKDLENINIPHVSLFDRAKFIYSQMFVDSISEKAAVSVFIPGWYFKYSVTVDNDGVHHIQATPVRVTAQKPSDFVSVLEGFIDSLNDPKYGLVRGDLIKTFPEQYVPGLIEDLYGQLALTYNDDVNAQLENASMLFSVLGEGSMSFTLDIDSDNNPSLVWTFAGVNDPGTKCKADYDQQLINFHGKTVPDSGELLSITRLMPVAKQTNNGTNSIWTVTGTSGDVILRSILISGVTSANISFWVMNIVDAQTSSIQSTMRNALNRISWAAKIIDYFPMVITDPSQPWGYEWDVDDFAMITKADLMMYTRRANRSLMYVGPLKEGLQEIGIAAQARR